MSGLILGLRPANERRVTLAGCKPTINPVFACNEDWTNECSTAISIQNSLLFSIYAFHYKAISYKTRKGQRWFKVTLWTYKACKGHHTARLQGFLPWRHFVENATVYRECIVFRCAFLLAFIMTSSNGNIFRVTGNLCGEFTGPGEFPAQRPVTRSFDVSFDLRPNKRLSKPTLRLVIWEAIAPIMTSL